MLALSPPKRVPKASGQAVRPAAHRAGYIYSGMLLVRAGRPGWPLPMPTHLLVCHKSPQHVVDARLVALSGLAEPGQHVPVDAQFYGVLARRQADHGGLPPTIRERAVFLVGEALDVGLAHGVRPRPIGAALAGGDLWCGLSATAVFG